MARVERRAFNMKTYRRRKGHDTWHWCRNCSNWPTSDYEEQTSSTRPKSGELDNECLAKEKAGTCS
jgi:hypothetical protein